MIKKSLFVLFFTISPCLSAAEELTLGGSYNLSILPVIAANKGFFQEEGLLVKHEVISIGKLAMDAVLSDAVDVGVIVDANISFISFRKHDLKVIATLLRQSTDGLFYCFTDSPPSTAILKGKKIGYVPATTSHIYLSRLLKSLDLSFKDIRAVPLQPTSMAHAIKLSGVDAVSVWNPWRHNIKEQMQAACHDESGRTKLYPSYAYLVARKGTIDKKQTALTKLLSALIKAEEYIINESVKSLNLYKNATNMDHESALSIWHNSKIKIELNSEALNIISETTKWLTEYDSQFKGHLVPELTGLFYADILLDIAPHRVKLNTAQDD